MRRKRKPKLVDHPWWVLGPDLHGPTLYRRCKTYQAALRFSRYLGGGMTIVRCVLAGERDILSDRKG